MIRLAAPEWLVLVPVVMIAAWWWRARWAPNALRIAATALLLLALVDPELRRQAPGLDVWALMDRSLSADESVEPRRAEMEKILERARGTHDRLFLMDYADIAEMRLGTFTGNRRSTRTAGAVLHALSRMDPDRPSRLLVVTDGQSTEPAGDLGERLRAQGVPMDLRIIAPPDRPDYRAVSVRAPARVRPGEAFLLEATIEGAPDAPVPYAILRDGATLARGTAAVARARATLRYTDRLAAPGAHRYELVLQGGDGRPGNDRAETWVELAAGPRVLLVTAYPDDPVAAALAAQGIECELAANPRALHPGRLSGARAVWLHNVPAHELPTAFLDALPFFVREQGGGLAMVGGRRSFGAGGYFESPVDPILPVSMELKQEHRKLAVAMAIVLDRSGSMAAGVGGSLTKMDLADAGAARVADLLGDRDAVSVIAVDSEPHVVVPLTEVGSQRAAIQRAAKSIRSAGGGIFVYTGLQAGWAELQKAQQGQRHLILFADAADAEEPGEYIALLDEMTRAGVTVSVIGLGTPQDSDAAFLQDVAARGKGRIFFNADPGTLPALFAQEAVAVSRSAFLDEPVGYVPAAGWSELAARPLAWLAAVDGYNLSYLRDGAAAAAVGADEYKAPLVASWQRGMGRSAAVSFPLGGDYSARVRAWPAYGDFVRTLARWSLGEDVPPGLGLRVMREGNELAVDLLFDATWEESFAAGPPRLALEAGSGLERPVWRRMEPGRFHAQIPLEPGQTVRGAIQVGKHAIPFGPVSIGTDAEWSVDRARVDELRAAMGESGGQERVDLASIWSAPRRSEFTDLRGWLLSALLLAFLLDALMTRLGWTWRRRLERAPAQGASVAPPPSVRKTKAGRRVETILEEEKKSAVAPSPSPPVPPTRSILDRAKRGR